MPVPERLGLGDEREPRFVRAGRRPVRRLVAGRGHQADLLGAGVRRLVKDEFERLLLDPVPIDQGLNGQRPLTPARGGDDRFAELHERTPANTEPAVRKLE
ncbi:hypothetical protein [Frigoriglobus tundricola]|uniref:hypothetical protein n=1 Tax=Frigoriglobus tundricola TaxID=2774151 RepID=UPI001D091C04|nr:hypothetical protein [Frigoriglobus tundricola]